MRKLWLVLLWTLKVQWPHWAPDRELMTVHLFCLYQWFIFNTWRDGPFCQPDRSVNRTVLSTRPFCQWQNGPVDRTVRLDRTVLFTEQSVLTERSGLTERSLSTERSCLTERSLWQNGTVFIWWKNILRPEYNKKDVDHESWERQGWLGWTVEKKE
jgi:hypothetical protein